MNNTFLALFLKKNSGIEFLDNVCLQKETMRLNDEENLKDQVEVSEDFPDFLVQLSKQRTYLSDYPST